MGYEELANRIARAVNWWQWWLYDRTDDEIKHQSS